MAQEKHVLVARQLTLLRLREAVPGSGLLCPSVPHHCLLDLQFLVLAIESFFHEAGDELVVLDDGCFVQLSLGVRATLHEALEKVLVDRFWAVLT